MSSAAEAAALPGGTRRGVADVIRRGFDNTIANWPLILLRVVENMLFGMIAIGGAIAAAIPVIGFLVGTEALKTLEPLIDAAERGEIDTGDATHIADTAASFLVANWWIFPYALIAVSVILLVLVAVHSFFIGGVARVLVDGERAAGALEERSRFDAFTIQRWIDGATDRFWTVFWIYNLAYGVLGLILLVPLLFTLAVMLLLRESPAAIVAGCLGIVLTVGLGILTAILASLWSQKAIVVTAARRDRAWDALRIARREIMRDFGRHAGVVVIMFVITIATAGMFGSMSLLFMLPGLSVPVAHLFLIPLRFAISLMSGAVTAAVSNWMLAAFAAITEPSS